VGSPQSEIWPPLSRPRWMCTNQPCFCRMFSCTVLSRVASFVAGVKKKLHFVTPHVKNVNNVDKFKSIIIVKRNSETDKYDTI